jgi:large subunit ribosomal protein L15
MPLSIHTIKPKKGSFKKRKRIGRGNASGTGTYSGKGQKGQNSRAGVSNLKRLGLRQMLLQTPKKRGFKSRKPDNRVIKVEDINKNFKDNEIVSPKTLLKKGLISNLNSPIKILGKEKLSVKIKFEDVKMSKAVAEQVEKK